MPALAHVGDVAVDPVQVLPLVAAAVLYGRRVATLTAAGRPVPAARVASFYVGVALVVGVVVSPLGHLGEELFLAHMTEHLLMADIGALLIVLGLTGPVLAPALRLRGLRWVRALGHPAPAFALWAVNLYAWHVPVLHEAAVRLPWVHALQHALFVGLGVAMWMPLFGPLPRPAWFGNLAKLVYIVAVRLTGALLGNVLVWANTPLYDVYDPGRAEWGISPLADEQVAGAIMMVEGSLLTLILFGWLFLRAAREGEERQELLDLAGRQGVALDERRAARAVAAGRGDELRERILSSG